MTPRAGKTRGLSLIELVVALALFAMVAIMGAQAINGTLFLRDRLISTERDTAQMTFALALLENDLGAAVPLSFIRPDGSTASALDVLRDGFALSTGGRGQLPGEAGDGFARVEWHLDSAAGRLSRVYWPVLSPAPGSAAPARVTLLEGISAIDVESYYPASGWQRGARTDAGIATALPDGARITLHSRAHGPLQITVAFR